MIVTLKSDEIYLHYVSNINEKVNWKTCVPKGSHKLSIVSPNVVQMEYTLKVDDEIIMKYYNPKFIGDYIYSFTLPVLRKVIFSYPNSVIYVNQKVSIQPNHDGLLLCDEYSVFDSNLPDGLVINRESGNIEGSPTATIKSRINVKCYLSKALMAVTNAAISVEACVNSVPLSIVINSGEFDAEKMVISLTSPENVKFLSIGGMLSSKAVFYSFCLSSTNASLALGTLGGQWPSGASVLVRINNDETKYEEKKTVTISSKLSDFEKWQYSKSYTVGWVNDKMQWPKMETFPDRSTTTTYFKKDFYYFGDENTMYYLLNLKHKGGVVIYVNGQIVHIYKVQNEFSEATDPLDNIAFSGEIRLLTYNLNIGLNRIAVELHCTVKEKEDFALSISVETDYNQCKTVSSPDMKMYYSNEGLTNEKYGKMIDGKILEKYSVSESSKKVGLWFKTNYNYPINRIDYFVSNDCPNRDWWVVGANSVHLNRDNNGADTPPRQYYTQIKSIQYDNTLTTADEDRSDPYFMYSQELPNVESMQALYLEITPRNGTSKCLTGVQTAEVRLLSCKPKFCLASEKVAKFGYEGTIEEVGCLYKPNKIKYKCNKQGKWIAIDDESVCSIKYFDE